MGVCPVKVSKTLAALVKRSPDSPTQMFKHSLRMRRFRIGFKINAHQNDSSDTLMQEIKDVAFEMKKVFTYLYSEACGQTRSGEILMHERLVNDDKKGDMSTQSAARKSALFRFGRRAKRKSKKAMAVDSSKERNFAADMVEGVGHSSADCGSSSVHGQSVFPMQPTPDSFCNDQQASALPSVSKGATKECPVCVTRQPIEQFPRLICCNHRACLSCLIELQILESRVNLTCYECNEMLHPDDVYSILKNKPNLIEKYEEFSVRRVLMSDPDTRWCPAPDCSYAVIASGCAACPEIKCERIGCGASFCYHCKMIWHSNQTCDEAKASRRSMADSPMQIDVNVKPGDLKACPRCKTYIVKMNDGSCNHMICALCGVEFCWLCLREISDLHYLSPSGCTFWGKKPWSRKKKLIWQVSMLVGAPVGIALVAGLAVPAIIFGFPVWIGRKIHQRLKYSTKFKRILAILGGVAGGVVLSPVLASLAISVGVPILLAYVYGVVLVSLCRNGYCGVNSSNSGVRLDSDETVVSSAVRNELMQERAFLLREVDRQDSENFITSVSSDASCQNSIQIQVDVCDSTVPAAERHSRFNVEALSTKTFETACFDDKSIRTYDSFADTCNVSLQEGDSLKGLHGSLGFPCVDEEAKSTANSVAAVQRFQDSTTLNCDCTDVNSSTINGNNAVEPSSCRGLDSLVLAFADEQSASSGNQSPSEKIEELDNESSRILLCCQSDESHSKLSCKHRLRNSSAEGEGEFLLLPSDAVLWKSGKPLLNEMKMSKSSSTLSQRPSAASTVLNSILEMASDSTAALDRTARGLFTSVDRSMGAGRRRFSVLFRKEKNATDPMPTILPAFLDHEDISRSMPNMNSSSCQLRSQLYDDQAQRGDF
ncbi:E3 ubiquitin-protein ligase RNF19B [Trichinella nativa]|uniref:RBR-type E3 ubiquitin transferase n=1 Tax=Trichinella nativa TaxID=6335 RepID=A0A0V1L303_9BILA|nr:E3 ubiquitin-protein ligase RNF19B [Trichinella nativa]KRZ53929.1 E3 ubiquitin-protein ligase RNF19B [Trichinella nativa]